MRFLVVSTVAALAVTTVVASGEARPLARPRIELAPPVRVVAFRRLQPGSYAGGALGVAVDVENTTNADVDGVSVKLAIGEKVLETTLSIPARAAGTATFTDDEGLASSCKPKPYAITLAGPGTGGARRNAQITPTCTFSTRLEQTSNQMSPDRVEAQRSGNAYLTAPALVSAPTCGKGPTIRARIVNNASVGSPSLIVQAKEWSASATVHAQTSAAFPLAVRESKDVLLTPVGDGDVPAKMALGIVDWTKSLGGRTSDGGIFVVTSRSCALDVALR